MPQTQTLRDTDTQKLKVRGAQRHRGMLLAAFRRSYLLAGVRHKGRNAPVSP